MILSAILLIVLVCSVVCTILVIKQSKLNKQIKSLDEEYNTLLTQEGQYLTGVESFMRSREKSVRDALNLFTGKLSIEHLKYATSEISTILKLSTEFINEKTNTLKNKLAIANRENARLKKIHASEVQPLIDKERREQEERERQARLQREREEEAAALLISSSSSSSSSGSDFNFDFGGGGGDSAGGGASDDF